MNGTCGVRVRQINVSFSILRTRTESRRARAIFHLILVVGCWLSVVGCRFFDECQILLSVALFGRHSIYLLFYLCFLTIVRSSFFLLLSFFFAIWMLNTLKSGWIFSSSFAFVRHYSLYVLYMPNGWQTFSRMEENRMKKKSREGYRDGRWMRVCYRWVVGTVTGVHEHEKHTHAHRTRWIVVLFFLPARSIARSHSLTIYFENRKTREWIMYILFTFKTQRKSSARAQQSTRRRRRRCIKSSAEEIKY